MLRNECPKIQLEQNFNVNRFMGRWYEKYRSKKLGPRWSIKNKECNSNNFTKREDGYLEKLETSMQINRKKKSGGDNEFEIVMEGRAKHLQIP